METIATLVAALVVFVAAGIVILHDDPVPDAGQTPGFSVAAGPTSQPSSSSAVPSKVVAFLGDDFTAGAGASDPSRGFVALVSRRLGVIGKKFSVAGGYAKSSAGGKVYADRVAAVAAAGPDVVVVTGGHNDSTDDPSTRHGKVADLFAALQKALPKAVLVAVAPFWGDSSPPPALAALAAAIRAGVRAAGGSYVDLPDPLLGHPEWMSDGVDPNDGGYAAIATALVPKLTAFLSKP